MRSNRRQDALAFQSTAAVVVDDQFPAAVRGEDYDRYARAIWRQGERWFTLRAHQISRDVVGMHESREMLSAAAARELGRSLHPQEERLLSELLHQSWRALEQWHEEIQPEIPSFLVPAGR